jgi:hypothetical protein
MYTIIGADGKEYGPVTVEQVRAWMAGGRANLTTKVKAVGTDVWKTIGEVPEITGSAAAPGAASYASPGTADLDILSCFSRSWDLLKANFWSLVGATFLIMLIQGFLLGLEKNGLYFLGVIFNKVLSGGLYYFFLLKMRGNAAAIGDVFAGFTKAFLPLVVIGLLYSVFVTVGVICLILPGIYLVVAYAFSAILAVDKGLGFWEAMETSRKVITRNWWHMLGLLLLCIPVLILGCLALGVGIFVAMPVVVGAIAYAYEDLCNRGR